MKGCPEDIVWFRLIAEQNRHSLLLPCGLIIIEIIKRRHSMRGVVRREDFNQ